MPLDLVNSSTYTSYPWHRCANCLKSKSRHSKCFFILLSEPCKFSKSYARTLVVCYDFFNALYVFDKADKRVVIYDLLLIISVYLSVNVALSIEICCSRLPTLKLSSTMMLSLLATFLDKS